MSNSTPQHLGVFDMFRIGIGPSSSHTVGPMRAAKLFARALLAVPNVAATLNSVSVRLYGSLGATGRGHATDRAVVLGLSGYEPATIAPDTVTDLPQQVATERQLHLGAAIPSAQGNALTIAFDPETDITFAPLTYLPGHPNALTLKAKDDDGNLILERTYYSVGGGFVVAESDLSADADVPTSALGSADSNVPVVPHPFSSGVELLEHCEQHNMRICEIARANELTLHTDAEISQYVADIWAAMDASIDAGIAGSGRLPGSLRVPRRAPGMYRKLRREDQQDDPLRAMDWISLYALAVNEENASGHRVVTAPTNGAAGIVPAVLKYFLTFVCDGTDSARQIEDFLITASAVGSIIKRNASIAGAEVGCQGEVGSACAMAAAGLTEVLGGSPQQVENASEIAMEHNLGLTCDPVGGLVQVPCIERNAIGAVKAISAARIALRGDGIHTVSLDAVIETMRQTGLDMHSKYKETSMGGLAVNIIEC